MAVLHAEVLTAAAITPNLREAMYALYSRYFEATSRDRFETDLSGKTHSIVICDESDVLRGFSTLALFDSQYQRRPCQVVFSGDTIVHHDYWGHNTLPMVWLEQTGVFKARHPDRPLFWFLIVKGYRTYRYLPLFAKNYYPNYAQATPPDLQSMLAKLANERFGSCYDETSGVIHFAESMGHLTSEWAGIPERVAERPEVQFFLASNPGHVRGDELACITELSIDNLRRRARVPFEKGLAHC